MSSTFRSMTRVSNVVMDVTVSSAVAVIALALAANVSVLSRMPWLLGSLIVAIWIALWVFNQKVASLPYRSAAARRFRDIFVPLIFGLTLLWLWEVICRGFNVPMVLMPAPSHIFARIVSSLPTLGADFVQTVIRAAIPGWLMGCLAGFGVALLCDRFDFLRRGLLPIGNFISALPIIGIAPILVMWFGFDWHSKAAVWW